MLKLWQAIGLQLSDYQNANIISGNPPQFITNQFAQACTKTVNGQNINTSCLKQLKQQTTQFVQYQDRLPRHSNHDLSIQIESCDSQPLDSVQSNINIRSSCNKAITNAETKSKLGRIVQNISSISKEFLQFKIWAQQIALVRRQQLQSAAGQLSLISGLLQAQLKQVAKCTKCESTRSVIDNLTRQCWHLQEKCKQQPEVANQEAVEAQASKVQACLLTQRGDTIAKLKKEVNELRQENQQLHQMLFLRDNQLLNLQNKYRQNLQLLKSQMEELAETCHVNFHNVFQHKSALEAERLFLRNKLKTAEEQLSSQQQQRSLKRTFLTQYIPHVSNDVQTTLSNFRPRRVTQKVQQRFRTPQKNENGSQQSFLNQSARLFSQAQLNNHTDRQFATQNAHLACLHNIKNSFTRSPLGKRKEAGKSTQTLEVPSACFQSALSRLEELQRGVRKQINRSKKNKK